MRPVMRPVARFSSVRRRVLAGLGALLFALSLGGCSLLPSADPGQVMLDDIVRPDMNAVESYVDNWYLFYNDRIYAYLYDYNRGDLFFSTDLTGNDQKMISQSDEMRYAELYFIYDGCAYFYSTYKPGVKKIDIATGEITDVVRDKYLYLMQDTQKDGKVLVQYENNYAGMACVYVATLDLHSGELSDEKNLRFTAGMYHYCPDNQKVYSIDGNDDDTVSVCEDNFVIATFPDASPDGDFAFSQDGYIFAVIADQVIRMDRTTYEVLDQKPIGDEGFQLFPNERPRVRTYRVGELTAFLNAQREPVFRSNDRYAYTFDSASMSFKKIPGIGAGDYEFVQDFPSGVILQGLDVTAIYQPESQKADEYATRRAGFDQTSVYMLHFDGDFYAFGEKYQINIAKLTM